MSLVIRILHCYFIVYYYTGSSSVNWLAVSCILTATLWDTGFKCKSSTQFMCLIINHFVTYYSNLEINYMVTVFIRLVIAVVYTLHLLSCSKCFVCSCLFPYKHCFLVGWCTNRSYVIATSDLWLFIHVSNLLPLNFPPHSPTYPRHGRYISAVFAVRYLASLFLLFFLMIITGCSQQKCAHFSSCHKSLNCCTVKFLL